MLEVRDPALVGAGPADCVAGILAALGDVVEQLLRTPARLGRRARGRGRRVLDRRPQRLLEASIAAWAAGLHGLSVWRPVLYWPRARRPRPHRCAGRGRAAAGRSRPRARARAGAARRAEDVQPRAWPLGLLGRDASGRAAHDPG